MVNNLGSSRSPIDLKTGGVVQAGILSLLVFPQDLSDLFKTVFTGLGSVNGVYKVGV
jgi:hypothetical protein